MEELNLKHVVILGDGMADFPIPELGGKTPLQKAYKPNMDFIAKHGILGLVKTVPDGISPGSDTANLSVFGYDPIKYYTGRSPLEAVGMGIDMAPDDVAFRCNLVTLSDEPVYNEKTMLDYSSGEISTEEAAELIHAVNRTLGSDELVFCPGISYRHCLLWKNGPNKFNLTPPHDILTQKINAYLPEPDENHKKIYSLMEKSIAIFKDHPVNQSRIAKGLNPASSIWLWGNGKKAALPSFRKKYHTEGAVIAAVDLLKGIALCADLQFIEVEGATGNLHTNFTGKANAAIQAMKTGTDFIYLHLAAPDECGHHYEIENKVKAIALIDEKVVGPILQALSQYDDYKVLVLPDHPTPLSLRTHTSDPVPFAMYQKSKHDTATAQNLAKANNTLLPYDEDTAASTGLFVDPGYTLMDMFIES